MHRSHRLVSAAVVVLLAGAVNACGASDEPDGSVPTSCAAATTKAADTRNDGPARAVGPAIRCGARYLAGSLKTEIDPVTSLALYDYLFRAYGISELAGAQETVAAARPEPGSEDERLWRLVEGDWKTPTKLPTAAAAASSFSSALTLALYCDRVGLPPGYGDALLSLSRSGGYSLSHAALAVGWVSELGCAFDGLEEVRKQLVDGLSAGLGSMEVGDLAFEYSAMLVYLGERDRIPSGWVGRIVAAQNDDGGWTPEGDGAAAAVDLPAGSPSSSHWHTSLLGLWTLVGSEQEPAAPMLPGGRLRPG